MKRAARKNNSAEARWSPAARWVRHARALRSKMLRDSLSGGLLQMEFLRRAAARRQVHHLWQLAVSRFSPQIHLAIQPLLRETVWREPPVSVIREHASAWVNAPQPAAAEGVPEATVPPIPARRADSPGAVHLRIFPAKRGGADEFTTLDARLRRYTRLRRETSESVTERVIHRMARHALRVEEAPPGMPAMMVHRPAPASIRTEHLAAPESEPGAHPPPVLETTHEAPWARAAAAPAMSIDYLTDQVIRQIDSRMIAMRERMGRI